MTYVQLPVYLICHVHGHYRWAEVLSEVQAQWCNGGGCYSAIA